MPWALGALGLAFGARTLWTPLPAPALPVRLSVGLGVDVSLEVTDAGAAAILSPDGSLLAFVARPKEAERPQLFLRRLDQLKAAPLPGTEGARSPFFSPDGRWIAFFADGQLKRVAVSGGATVVLANAPTDRGGTWSEDGTILFTPGSMPGVGLSRVSSSGGATEVLTRPDPGAGEATHRWPQSLPGGKAVLFTANRRVGGYEDASIVVQRLPHGPTKTIVQGGYYGRYLPSGHIVYMHDGTLFAIPFDLAQLEVAGPAVPVIQELVSFPNTAGAQFAFSNRGTLVYLPGRSAPMLSIQWLDRTGKLSPLRAAPGIYRNPRLSPDGTKLAIQVFDGKGADIWVCEWGLDTMSKLTFDATNGSYPVWAPDGRGVAYTSLRGSQPGNIFWQRADGTGSPQFLTKSKNFQIATSWHPSGRYLAFQEFNQETGFQLMILPIEGDEASGLMPGQPTPFLNSPFSEQLAAFSPDGRWLAYSSNESGRVEVYLRPFPGPGGKWQISSEGGSFATWSRNGRELVYETIDQRLMAVSFAEQAGSFHADKPRLWGETRLPDLPGFRTFDRHPDGQRLAVLKGVELGEKQNKVVLVENFFDELRRLAPKK
jgi:Tol biopolymer transport system component